MDHRINLILVPGLLCTADLWRDQITGLADIATITVADHHLDDNIPDIAARILKDAPDEFAVAGLSMGGYIAMELMRQAGDRISHFSLMDTTVDADSPERRIQRLDFLKLVEIGSFKGVTAQLMPQLIHQIRLNDTDLTGRIYQMADDIGKGGFVQQMTAIMNRPDTWDLLHTITCPSLVLTGADDAMIPADRQRVIAEEIPGAVFREIAECGHLPTMETPDEVTIAMRDWLMR